MIYDPNDRYNVVITSLKTGEREIKFYVTGDKIKIIERLLSTDSIKSTNRGD